VFAHAKIEGIVSKRKDSPYRSGCSPDWLKSKNPACAAVKREEEENWGKEALARDTNHLAPRHTSNRRQSPDSDCVSVA
jgi:hypothetical protein